MGEQQFWIRVRVRNGGQIIEMHAPVAYAMIEGGTAVRVDAQNRECKPNGESLNATKQIETAAKNTTKVETAAKTKPPVQQGANFRRVPGQQAR